MTVGVREQKRRATVRAIQVALLELAVERGLDRVTIDEVARAAGVSPRTFFNYFDSKEDAVAGSLRPFEIDEGAAAAFVAGDGELLADLLQLVRDVARSEGDEPDWAVHRLRRDLYAKEPALLGANVADVRRFEASIGALAAARLRRAGVPEQLAADRARLATLVVTAITRSGWSRWVASDGSRPIADSMREAFEDFRELTAGA